MWDSAAEAKRWLRQAENDLEFARLGLREGFFSQACFLTQQSAEKAVKAIAYGLGERTVLGHSVLVLADRYKDRVPELDALRGEAGILDQYYIPYRPAAALPAVTAAASVTMNIRKPCSMRSAMSSTPAVIPHGTPWAWQAANTRWIAASTASMSPS